MGIVYIVILAVVTFFVGALWSQRCLGAGIKATTAEEAAACAYRMRLVEVALACIALAILWLVIRPGGIAFWVALLYSLYEGGVYIGSSLFAVATMHLRDQRLYFAEMAKKIGRVG